jgi:MscS family membrane protein
MTAVQAISAATNNNAATESTNQAAASDAATQPVGVGTLEEVSNALRTVFEENSLYAWAFLGGAIFLGLVLGRLIKIFLGRSSSLADKRNWPVRAALLREAGEPAALFVLAVGLAIGLGGLRMTEPVRDISIRALVLTYSISIAWLGWNLTGVLHLYLTRLASRTESNLDDQFVPLVRKAMRIVLIIFFSLYAAENVFGRDISAWLAGLGIAGLAVSLAAQDSIKNLFGSLVVLADRPFKVGDRIQVSGVEGDVEEIGFRSCRIRTIDGWLVTVPNARFSDTQITNISARNSIRRSFDLHLPRNTPTHKVRLAIRLIQDVITTTIGPHDQNPSAKPPSVHLAEINAVAFVLRITCWFRPTDQAKVDTHAEAINLAIVDALRNNEIEPKAAG